MGEGIGLDDDDDDEEQHNTTHKRTRTSFHREEGGGGGGEWGNFCPDFPPPCHAESMSVLRTKEMFSPSPSLSVCLSVYCYVLCFALCNNSSILAQSSLSLLPQQPLILFA